MPEGKADNFLPGGFFNLDIHVRDQSASTLLLNKADFENGKIRFDDAVIATIESNLLKRPCLLAGPRNRGKTYLAEAIGLRFLARNDQCNPHVYFQQMRWLDPVAALDTIYRYNVVDREADPYLFIIDACQADPDKRASLFAGLVNYKVNAASLLFTTCENLEGDEGVNETFAVIPIRPTQELLKIILQASGQDGTPQAIARLASLAGATPDLKVVAEAIRLAIASSISVEDIDENRIFQSIVREKLGPVDQREIFLRVAALAQFDLPVFSDFVEVGDHDTLERLVHEHVLKRSVEFSQPGLFYELADESEADILLRAAEAQKQLKGKTAAEFTADMIVEYVQRGAPNFAASVTGFVTLYGEQAQAALCSRADFREALIARIGSLDIPSFVGVLNVAHKCSTMAGDFLSAYELQLGQEGISARLESVPLWLLVRFLIAVKELSPEFKLPNIAKTLAASLNEAAGTGAFISAVNSLRKQDPILIHEALTNGTISASQIATGLSKRSAHRAFWVLRQIDKVVTPTDHAPTIVVVSTLSEDEKPTIGNILQKLGDAWLVAAINGTSGRVAAHLLEFARAKNRALYNTVVSQLDRTKLLESMRKSNSTALHVLARVLTPNVRKPLLALLTEADWAEITARSSLSTMAQLLYQLSFYGDAELGAGATKVILARATDAKFSGLHLSALHRILTGAAAFDAVAAQALSEKIAAFEGAMLQQMIELELPGQRFRAISLLAHSMRKVHLPAARRMLETISTIDTVSYALSEDLEQFQYVVYNFAMIDVHLCVKWLSGLDEAKFLEIKLIPGDLMFVMWTIWNVYRADASRGELWSKRVISAPSYRAKYSSADLTRQLALDGVTYIVTGTCPIRRRLPARDVTAVLREIESPEEVVFAFLGAIQQMDGRDAVSVKRYFRECCLTEIRQMLAHWKDNSLACYKRINDLIVAGVRT